MWSFEVHIEGNNTLLQFWMSSSGILGFILRKQKKKMKSGISRSLSYDAKSILGKD